jgi:hypothetical protein
MTVLRDGSSRGAHGHPWPESSTSVQAADWADGYYDLTVRAEAKGRPDFGVEHLEGDYPFVLEIVRQVDRGHAAAPELALEAVTIGEGVPKLAECVLQVGRPM